MEIRSNTTVHELIQDIREFGGGWKRVELQHCGEPAGALILVHPEWVETVFDSIDELEDSFRQDHLLSTESVE